MIDFFVISTRPGKRGTVEVYPKFIIKKSTDLMIRGGDFYAIWVEERGLWSTDEDDVVQLIDRELNDYAQKMVTVLKKRIMQVRSTYYACKMLGLV